MNIVRDVKDVPKHKKKHIVKIIWHGERIAKLVFASGCVIDFFEKPSIGVQK